MASVRGKFYVQQATKDATGSHKVRLRAVSRGAHNAAWSMASPDGTIELTISNRDAFDVFDRLVDSEHREVYVDFTPVPETMYDPTKHAFEPFVMSGHYVDGKCLECGLSEQEHRE